MSTNDTVQQIFQEAQKAFRNKLKDPGLYDEILTTTTASEVHKATIELQENMVPKGRLRALGRIKPFLIRLSEYANVIEVFVQVKPDLLALIWGPVKIILMWSSQITAVHHKIVDLLASIGLSLPQFAEMARTFETSDVVKTALSLFYEDILELYHIIFDFFRKTRWKQFFDVIWSRYQPKIDIVVGNIAKHSLLMHNEVTFLDIKEAKEARVQSYKHFAETQTFQAAQRFLNLKTRVSPNLYADRLDWLRNRCVPGCADWLFRDGDFCEWLDPSKRTIVWLWLQGIPGAGKTYLTAAAIDHTRKQHRTLYAFVNHATKNGLTALSVIHSLIFQAAEDDKDFQSLLVELKERELHGNTAHAVEVLRKFLTKAGPTYIIIDGLDEMDEFERQILLQRLEELSKDCEDLRLLICSRAEDDISRALDQKARSIRVNDKNSGSIQTYVDRRTDDWTSRRQFDKNLKLELIGLISPLSARANGMFLYARIILDNLEQMTSIEEIRRELNALPSDLDDAYHRIFDRINESRPQVRDKCRQVLGWIGCAPVPFTALEMEQMLSVNLDHEKEYSEIPCAMANVNFVQLCGPIIEIVDEKLQFVHFTVEQYIFSRDIRNFIDKVNANTDLVKTFLAYLGSGVLEQDLDDEDIDENILTGKYRLFDYASFYWPTLFHQVDKNEVIPSNLGVLLHKVIERGRNYDFESATDNLKLPYKNEPLLWSMPNVFNIVCETFHFHLNDKRWDWNWVEPDKWVNIDPLTTSQTSIRIQERLEDLISEPAYLPFIQSHYGSRLFKCTYLFCKQSRRGFETQSDRNEHIKHHGKPWKCSVPDCPFSTIGFTLKSRRDEHWLKLHLPSVSQLEAGLDGFENLDAAEAQPMLFALAIEGDIESAQRLLSSPGGKQLKAEVIASARHIAAKEGSLAMTQLLAPQSETYAPANIVISAIESGDVDFAKWAISRVQPEDCAKIMKAMLGTASEEIYALWEEYILMMPQMVQKGPNRRPKDMHDDLFKQALFSDIKDSPLKEARVKHTLRKLSGRIDLSVLGVLLVRVAKSSCSVPLAEELLALGASIDYPMSHNKKGMTALHAAAKNTTKEAAFLMEYLILRGAFPLTHSGHDIGKEKGATDIAKWVGKTWQELQQQRLMTETTFQGM